MKLDLISSLFHNWFTSLILFVNFRKLVEIVVATGGPGDKKHFLCTKYRLLAIGDTYEQIFCCIKLLYRVSNQISATTYNQTPVSQEQKEL